MSNITTAPAADDLVLTDTETKLFLKRDETDFPCLLSIPGGANFALHPFNVNATGIVNVTQACNLTITLYAAADYTEGSDPVSLNNFLPLAISEPEPIGGDDLSETMWMMRGENLLYSLESGRLQGTFLTNLADHPIPAADLQQHLSGINSDQDPVLVFAIGVKLEPQTPPERMGDATKPKSGEDEPPPLGTVTLVVFEMAD